MALFESFVGDNSWWIEGCDPDDIEEAGNTDWLDSPPDHVRNHTLGKATDLNVLNQVGPEGSDVSAPTPPSSRFMTVHALLATSATRYLVSDLLPERGLIAFFGPPGGAKTFLVIDLMGALASGRSHWFGRRLVQSSVAFVALEGRGGMRKRVKAWLAHGDRSAPTALQFFDDRLSLLDVADTELLANEIVRDLGVGTVTVIDTLSRAMPGGDENNSIDMTTIIANADLLGTITRGPVILVHHTGKDAGKGLRGHSSLLAAVDVAVEVVNDKGNRSWSLRKNKDGPDGGFNTFELVPYPVETDQWGDEVTSCAVRQLIGPAKQALRPVSGKNRVAVMAAVQRALSTAPAGIDLDRALEAAASVLTIPGMRRNTVAKTTTESLIADGYLVRSEGKVRLP